MGKKDAILVTVLMNCILLFFVFFTGRQNDTLPQALKEEVVVQSAQKLDGGKKRGGR